MNDIAIKVENLGKLYRLGEVGTGTISHDLNRWIAKIRGKEDPFKIIGETNDRTQKGESDYVWALKDLNFEVKKGEVLGIVGKNGAGKSTLLKLLSKVTQPSTGNIKVNGRIASLLEVGTGFHPEMTGRENTFLNGAIMGMTKREIKSKFDEIVEFAGVERYIDTPVKRYSSGMYVRLAFAVAAHLEPEILIVDEVLAVGDAEFQKKCLGKMKDVSVNDGRTVLFVSHNMAAVKQLCTSAILMQNGRLNMSGNVEDIVKVYNEKFFTESNEVRWETEHAPGNSTAKVRAVKISSPDNSFYIENELTIEVEFDNYVPNNTLNVSLSVFDDNEVYIMASPNLDRQPLATGTYKSVCTIPANLMNTGKFYFTVLLVGENFSLICDLEKIVSVELQEEGVNRKNFFGNWSGVVRPYLKWENRKTQ